MTIVTPVASLFDPATGIYSNPVNEGTAWERAASAEWINPDGSEGFQIDAGLRVYGGYSRQPTASPKHSFRLAFRADYGTSKLEYPLYPDSEETSFDTMVLRAQFNYAYPGVGFASNATYLQDQFARDTQLAMGDLAGHGRFVHLYLNGVYWGLYNAFERADAEFAALHLGGDASDYDQMKTFELQEGNMTAWNTAQQIASGGLASAAAYDNFKQYVDVENLANYVIVNAYGGNWDWPQNNWVAIRRSRVSGVPVNDFGFSILLVRRRRHSWRIDPGRSSDSRARAQGSRHGRVVFKRSRLFASRSAKPA